MDIRFSPRDFNALKVGALTLVELKQAAAVSTGSSTKCQWEGVLTGEEGARKFKFTTAGSVYSGGLPINMFTGGVLSQFDVSGSSFIKLKVETNGISLTSTEIVVGDDPSQPIGNTIGVAPSEFEIDLWAIKDAKAYRIIPCSSVSIRAVETVRTDKDDAPCNQSPFNVYWTWEVYF